MVASDFVGIVSAKNDLKKMEKTGWNIEKATMVNAPVFTDFPMTLECRIKEKYGRRGNSPWIAPALLTKYLSTTEHEERQITDSMHLCPQPLYL